jgi:hypothetical protein
MLRLQGCPKDTGTTNIITISMPYYYGMVGPPQLHLSHMMTVTVTVTRNLRSTLSTPR